MKKEDIEKKIKAIQILIEANKKWKTKHGDNVEEITEQDVESNDIEFYEALAKEPSKHNYQQIRDAFSYSGRIVSGANFSFYKPYEWSLTFSLEDYANRIKESGVPLSDKNLRKVLCEESDRDLASQSDLEKAFFENDGRKILFNGYPQSYAHEFVSELAESFVFMNIPVEELPAIVLSDGYFLDRYITVINNDDWDYGKSPGSNYPKAVVDFIYRLQSELDLKNAKEEQDALNGRSQKIIEAETLVEQQQGKQPE